jgi:hypothetical protein
LGFTSAVFNVPVLWNSTNVSSDLKYEKGWHAEYWFFRDPAT